MLKSVTELQLESETYGPDELARSVNPDAVEIAILQKTRNIDSLQTDAEVERKTLARICSIIQKAADVRILLGIHERVDNKPVQLQPLNPENVVPSKIVDLDRGRTVIAVVDVLETESAILERSLRRLRTDLRKADANQGQQHADSDEKLLHFFEFSDFPFGQHTKRMTTEMYYVAKPSKSSVGENQPASDSLLSKGVLPVMGALADQVEVHI